MYSVEFHVYEHEMTKAMFFSTMYCSEIILKKLDYGWNVLCKAEYKQAIEHLIESLKSANVIYYDEELNISKE